MGHRMANPLIVVTIPTTPTPTVYDLTDDAASCTLDGARAVISRPLFGDLGMRRDVKGLFDGSISIDFNHDYDEGKVTQLMWDAMLADDLVEIAVRAFDAVVSADNPEWICQVAVESFAAINGGAGELATGTLTLPTHGVPQKVIVPTS
jgi:hypothetical protein